jgi:hypothetical protein
MADKEKKISVPSVKKDTETEKLPVSRVTERNTQESEDVSETNKDTGERASAAVDMVVARTGQVPSDVNALEAELNDQVLAEAEAEKQSVALSPEVHDALTLERRDHARTLQQALGLTNVEGQDPDSLRKLAEERNKVLQDRSRDTSKDNVLNSIPSNWIVTKSDADNIEAYNRFTGKEYSGPPADLMKSATANADKKVSNDEEKKADEKAAAE